MAVIVWDFADAFESGDFSGWDISEVDVSSVLSVDHYSTLAQHGFAPYSGAYCMHVNYSAATNNAYIGDSAIACADGETIWVRFNMYIDSRVATDSTVTDAVKILDFQSAASASIVSFGMNINASTDSIFWQVTDETTGTTSDTLAAELDTWNTIEIKLNIQTAAATGEIELYVTPEGKEPSSSVTIQSTLNQATAAVTKGLFGITGIAATTRGQVLFDNFYQSGPSGSPARIYPDKDRFAVTRTVTRSGHVFLGQGTVEQVQVTDGGSGASAIEIYDTDTSQTFIDSKRLALFAATAGSTESSGDSPFDVVRGCYAVVTDGGSGVEATVRISRAPNWFSNANIVQLGRRRNLSA